MSESFDEQWEDSSVKKQVFRISGVAFLAGGLFLAAARGAQAQMRPGMGQQQQPNMQQNMRPNNMMQNQQMNQQTREEMNFIANMRRNIKVEDDLSKLALKKSNSDQVKTFARQVIQENRTNDTSLNSANPQMSEMMFAAPVPSETKKAEKQMKKLTGPDFDKLYIGQMDGYIKDDKELTTQAGSTITTGNLASVTMQMRNTADNRLKQLADVAKSENLTLR